ncbi:hypothetical protein P879_00766 [Paragonimus westermani]|uniref:MAP kinase-activating death domain-containing protein n=1 Tax=Paragonimus westermani TaxID=34504 RepID=A0A8T0DW25_9TREM|nr:hypothetical protein P879_00766 [Paragonimus westermani]
MNNILTYGGQAGNKGYLTGLVSRGSKQYHLHKNGPHVDLSLLDEFFALSTKTSWQASQPLPVVSCYLAVSRCVSSGDLRGEINVVNMANNSPGTIRVCSDGFAVNMNCEKMFISIPNIKCCRVSQHDQFNIEFLDCKQKCLRTLTLQTDMATHLLHQFHVRITSISLMLSPASSNGSQSPASELSKTALTAH